jgi:hypothetical protein
MRKFICIVISILISGILSAQIDNPSDETYKACNDKLFTQVEVLPDFKKGISAFEDSLASYLKKKNAFPQKGNVTFSFVVTTKSKVLDIRKEEGDTQFEEVIQEALISIPDMWIPAKQNSHIVCAIVLLRIEFSKDKLKVKVFEY